jgi:hypothetical protein
MFKKNNKSNFDIGIHEIDHVAVEEKEDKPPMKLWKKIAYALLGVFLVLVAIVVVTNLGNSKVDTSKEPKPPEVEEDPFETVEPPLGIEEPDVIVEPEPEPQPTIEQPEKIIVAPEGYINYDNGILNVATVYPQNWFVSERTSESLEILKEVVDKLDVTKKETLVLGKAKFSAPLQIADFTPSDENLTNISVSFVSKGLEKPKDTKDVKNTTEPIELKPVTTEKVINKKKFKVTTFEIADTGQTLKGTRISVPHGDNTFELSLTALDSKSYVDSVVVLEKMAEYIQLK